MNPPGAPTKAADPLGAARYAMPKQGKQNAANIFLKARAAMYGVAPPYNPWHDPAFTGENEFANVENVAPVNLTGAIGVGNAPSKRPTQSIFGNVGRLPGEPPAAPKKSLRRRRHRRAAATRRRRA